MDFIYIDTLNNAIYEKTIILKFNVHKWLNVPDPNVFCDLKQKLSMMVYFGGIPKKLDILV